MRFGGRGRVPLTGCGLVPALAPVDGIEQGRDERHPGTAG